jgi:hypothetical protein
MGRQKLGARKKEKQRQGQKQQESNLKLQSKEIAALPNTP